MAGPLALRFVRSYRDVAELPATDAELAVAGRSNVGKSSLINALANRRDLARTSKTPGATRQLDAFEVGPEASNRWLVDLPGYGYAQRSRSEQQRWATMIERYLTERDRLDGVILLIDGEVGPTDLDLQARDWLASLDHELMYVVTKLDKVRPSRSRRRRSELVTKLAVAGHDISWVSVTNGAGVPALRTRVARRLGLIDT